jgi:Xaa-Pro aminopeptidase
LAVQSAVVDPRKFKTDDEYLYAQKTAWAGGQNINELFAWIDEKVSEAEFLSEKEQGKHEDPLAEMR